MTISVYKERKKARAEIEKLYYQTNKISLLNAFLVDKANNKDSKMQLYYINSAFGRVKLYDIRLHNTQVFPGSDNYLYIFSNKKREPEIFYHNTYIQKWHN